ncbi:hypothetical protein HmCmsJML028_03760 [Escherichia coli]|nr:hypothetical protein HmCmsJML028_03760 [Escherichia coli]
MNNEKKKVKNKSSIINLTFYSFYKEDIFINRIEH